MPLTSPQFYDFSDTDDFRQAMLYIAQFYPHALLLELGFSLGANILTRYVAEEGKSCRLVSACALASVCILSFSPFTHFSLLICWFQPWDILKAGHAYVLEAFTSSQPTDTRRA